MTIYLLRMEAHLLNVCLCHNGIKQTSESGVRRKTNKGRPGYVWGRKIPTNDASVPPTTAPIPRRRAEIYIINWRSTNSQYTFPLPAALLVRVLLVDLIHRSVDCAEVTTYQRQVPHRRRGMGQYVLDCHHNWYLLTVCEWRDICVFFMCQACRSKGNEPPRRSWFLDEVLKESQGYSLSTEYWALSPGLQFLSWRKRVICSGWHSCQQQIHRNWANKWWDSLQTILPAHFTFF